MRSSQLLVLMAIIATFLGGCTSLSRALGFEKNPPDEFKVVRGNALTVPPNASLKPPKEKDLNLKRKKIAKSAHALMTKDRKEGSGETPNSVEERIVEVKELDPATESLLSSARKKIPEGQETDKIREKVDDEAGVYAEPDSESIATKVLNFLKRKDKEGNTIDPEKEKDRCGEDSNQKE